MGSVGEREQDIILGMAKLTYLLDLAFVLRALIQLVESNYGSFQQDCLSRFSSNIDSFGAVAHLEHLAKIDLALI